MTIQQLKAMTAFKTVIREVERNRDTEYRVEKLGDGSYLIGATHGKHSGPYRVRQLPACGFHCQQNDGQACKGYQANAAAGLRYCRHIGSLLDVRAMVSDWLAELQAEQEAQLAAKVTAIVAEYEAAPLAHADDAVSPAALNEARRSAPTPAPTPEQAAEYAAARADLEAARAEKSPRLAYAWERMDSILTAIMGYKVPDGELQQRTAALDAIVAGQQAAADLFDSSSSTPALPSYAQFAAERAKQRMDAIRRPAGRASIPMVCEEAYEPFSSVAV